MASGKRPADPRAAVEKIRQEIASAQAWLAESEDLRVPKETAYARIDELVDDLAEAGAIDGSAFCLPDYRRPDIRDVDDLLELIAWINPEAIKAKLQTVVDDHYAGFDGSFDTRETHGNVDRMKAELFELECEEERFIRSAEQNGVRLGRRRGADPRAVMSIL